MKGLPCLPILVTKKTLILAFCNILNFLDIFSDFFTKFSNSHRYVSFWPPAGMPATRYHFLGIDTAATMHHIHRSPTFLIT